MKKILIIWAWSGIGKSLSEYYKKQGYDISVLTRSDYDLWDMNQLEMLWKELHSSSYDIIIFSAGVWYHREFRGLSTKEISEQIIVNTLAPITVLRAIEPEVKFVYLSSIMQHIPAKNMSIYSAMKRATSQALTAVSLEQNNNILSIDLWAVKTQMHIKAGMNKMVWKDIQKIIPKLTKAIESKKWTTTLFWDWWIMIYLIFPIYKIFLRYKK